MEKETIEKLRALPITSVAGRLGLKLRHVQGSDNCVCQCFRHDDRHPSLYFNAHTQTYRCFVCQDVRGDSINLVMQHRNTGFCDACQWLMSEFGIIEAARPQHVRQPKPATRLLPKPAPNPGIGSTQTPCFLPISYVGLKLSTQSDFCRAVVGTGILTDQQMEHAARRYRLGCTRQGHVIWWYIDHLNRLCEGKVMAYGADCHRDKGHKPVTITWLLKHSGKLPDRHTSAYCLFGEHLLATDPAPAGQEQPTICVVESEKTAVIMSELYPQALWLASGGMGLLSVRKLSVLADASASEPRRRVVLFPDTDPDGKAYAEWCEVAAQANAAPAFSAGEGQVLVTDLLERCASANQKALKIDIADYVGNEE